MDTCFDHPQAEIIAVADDNPEGLKKAAERLKVKTTYSDYKEMLAKEKPQIVAVCPRGSISIGTSPWRVPTPAPRSDGEALRQDSGGRIRSWRPLNANT